ncbi:MAG: 16S rRNA (uracil(1498)-N(3))-methyltransferase [Candidatus Edwardsbacteria bacterium]|nr:16S rRNA (uracil(1498)-N(3))-methyltransferase [Candidatus Edwardsbacteria bacterium]
MFEYFYVPPSSIEARQIVISGEEARHISRALRHKKGDQITIVDGQGGEYECTLAAISDGAVTANIFNRRCKTNETIKQVTLAQAVPKGQRMDFVIEKGTEIGLHAIIPLITENSVVKPADEKPSFNLPLIDNDSGGSKAARWQRIAIAAMKQSLRSVLPVIGEPVGFAKLSESFNNYDLLLMADEAEKKINLAAVFAMLPENRDVRKVLCLVGPEGGFSQNEKRIITEARGHIISLGTRRLRSETAGLVLSTVVLDRLGELG